MVCSRRLSSWLLASLARSDTALARRFVALFFVGLLANAILAARFFFPLPTAFAVSIAICVGVESGLFLRRSDGAWIRQFDAFGPDQPPPSWLEARASTTLHMAHGGRAYAVISRPTSGGACQATIAVVAPSGKTCGTAVCPGEQSAFSGSCAASLTVGYDGTAIEKLDERSVVPGGGRVCGFSWWTGFLQ